MKTYGGVDVQIHIFLTSAIPGDKWLASHPIQFNPPEKEPPSISCIGGWVGPRDLDNMVKKKKLSP
jgi:hypothetical protein